MSRARFRVNQHYIWLNVKELLARNRLDIWSLNDCNGTRTHNHFVCKWKLNHLANLATGLSSVASTYLCSALDCVVIISRACFRVNPLYSCLNGKEFLAWNRRNIGSLSDYNGTLIHNHLVRKRTLTHLAKLAKCLSCVVSTYLYGAFDYMVQSLFVLFISITAS